MKLPLLMIAAYLLNYWQIPFLLKKKQYLLFGSSLAIVILLLTFLFRLMGFLYLDQYCSEGPYPLFSWVDIPFHILAFHFPAAIMYFYKTTKAQEAENIRINLLEKEKAETELKYLKAQLNPHFLFNTLNNLYSFVIDQSPKAPKMILQLSGILDFILYKSRQPHVPLIEEIDTVENYIALERIKYGNRLQLTFAQTIHNQNQPISPLVFLSLVENAFKHGVRDSITKPEIKISVVQRVDSITFRVWNTKVVSAAAASVSSEAKGIGLANIRRQLDLTYPKQHSFLIEDTADYYSVTLQLYPNQNGLGVA